MEEFANVTVVAPLENKSSVSRQSSFFKPLNVRKYIFKDRSQAYGFSGTPADAVNVGINYILEEKPDLVITGINPGINISKSEIHISGTVSAAIEAVCNGVPAIASSLYYTKEELVESDFIEASEILANLTKKVLDNSFPEDIDLLNLNVPENMVSIEIKVTKLADNMLNRYVFKKDDGTFIIKPTLVSDYPKGTDGYCIFREKRPSLTPLKIDLTHNVDNLKNWLTL